LFKLKTHEWMELTDDQIEEKGNEARRNYELYLKKQEEEAERKLLSPILLQFQDKSPFEEEKDNPYSSTYLQD
jgi:hypothetical protein